MNAPKKFFWKVTSGSHGQEKVYAPRIGPYTKEEVEKWAEAEIRSTTHHKLNFDIIQQDD
jgi:hypothetical protein